MGTESHRPLPCGDPYLYPFVLLLLPVDTNRTVLSISGFAVGMLIDIFSLTPGLHASAFTLTAFMRQPILSLLTDKNTIPHALPLSPRCVEAR